MLPTAGTSVSINGVTYDVTGIDLGGAEQPEIDVTTLSDTQKQYIVSTLQERGELELEILYNPDAAPATGVSGTVTITFPLPSGQSTPANYSGSGFIKSWNATAELEDVWKGSITVVFDGVTGPTLTASA